MDSQSSTSVRKLPKALRTANFVYQILLIACGFVNTLLTAIDESVVHVPSAYFKCYAILISLLPVLWSNVLDASKKYIQTMTPLYSPESSIHEDKNIVSNYIHDDKNIERPFPIEPNVAEHSLIDQTPEHSSSVQETHSSVLQNQNQL